MVATHISPLDQAVDRLVLFLDSIDRNLARLVELEEERREAERGFEAMAEMMRSGTLGKPADERAPHDPRSTRR